MKVSYEGIGQWAATFACTEAVEGEMVKISGSGEVSACAAGDGFCGHVIIRDFRFFFPLDELFNSTFPRYPDNLSRKSSGQELICYLFDNNTSTFCPQNS